MNVKDYIVHETERQSGTMREAIGMYMAWDYARISYYDGFERPVLEDVTFLISLINGSTGYRKVPAVFNQGCPALEASVIPRAMANLFGYVDGLPTPCDNTVANVIVKEFLTIHPFADGNGRVASLLWNWLRGSLLDPEPMPYFFGEN